MTLYIPHGKMHEIKTEKCLTKYNVLNARLYIKQGGVTMGK